MATEYEPMTAAGTASTRSRETPRAKKTAGVAASIAVRRFQSSRAASPAARYSGMSGVKMHSWVTMNAPCVVRMMAPSTVTVVPAAARMAPPVAAIQTAMTSTAGLS